jgi:salicylate hydroxylase
MRSSPTSFCREATARAPRQQRYVVKPRRPVFSGVLAYRGVMPSARVRGWPWPHALVNWVGEGKHFLVFPVRAGTLLNYVGFLPADE